VTLGVSGHANVLQGCVHLILFAALIAFGRQFCLLVFSMCRLPLGTACGDYWE
jgi:hypothetical protein